MADCPECDYTYSDLGADAVPGALVSYARAIRARLGETLGLAEGLEALRHRPEPDVWSALEYAGHVRDLLLTQRERLLLALVETGPGFAPMYRNERVALAHYNEDDPATVGAELGIAADLFAWVFGRLDRIQLLRRCQYHYPELTERSLIWLGQHTVHECRHHLGDVERSLRAAGFPPAA